MTVSIPASTILSAHCFSAPCACHRFSASAAEEDLVKHSADDDKHVRAKKPSKPRTDLCLAGGLKSNPDSRDPDFICSQIHRISELLRECHLLLASGPADILQRHVRLQNIFHIALV